MWNCPESTASCLGSRVLFSVKDVTQDLWNASIMGYLLHLHEISVLLTGDILTSPLCV